MHPDPRFRGSDAEVLAALGGAIEFGSVFAQTPDGPRTARTPLVWPAAGVVQFHLSRRNALTPHLAGGVALVTVDGPQGYISPRWYDDRDTVPTWDYASLELEGPVRRLTDAELEEFLNALIRRQETRLTGGAWSAEEASADTWDKLFTGITGFAMQIEAQRPTLKLSQKRNSDERVRIACGLRRNGDGTLADLIAAAEQG